MVSWTRFSTELGLVTSVGMTIALPPFSMMVSATDSIFCASRAARTTMAPASAKMWLVVAPIPRLAPVMMATFPRNNALNPTGDGNGYSCVSCNTNLINPITRVGFSLIACFLSIKIWKRIMDTPSLASVRLRMIRVDNHSHIIHATIQEMVAAAKANNLTEYSITEHVSQFRELRDSAGFGSVHDKGRMFESLKEYRDEFGKIGAESLGIRIYMGLEVDYSPRYELKVGDFVNQEEWNILLCSVHEFEDGKDIETTGRDIVDRLVAYARWYDYFRLEQMALESEFVPFSVLSHPVRVSRAVKLVPPEIDDLLMDLATTARRRNRALELNGNDIDYAPGLVRKLALACSKASCRVSLGSDAHYPKDVFQNMDVAMDLVRKFKLQLL